MARAEAELREQRVAVLLEEGDARRSDYLDANEMVVRFGAAGRADEAAKFLLEEASAWEQAQGFYVAAKRFAEETSSATLQAATRRRLADLAWLRLQQRESEGRFEQAARFETLLRQYGADTHAAELDGRGSITIDTAPSGARVECWRYRAVDGARLELAPFDPATGDWPETPFELGAAPLRKLALPKGSYVLVLRHPEFRPVRYPVWIERLEHEVVGAPVPLLAEAAIGPGFVYVPAGVSLLGSNQQASGGTARRHVAVPGFLLAEYEVSAKDYREFLYDLIATQGVAAAQRRLPRQAATKGFVWRIHNGKIVEQARLPDTFAICGISWRDAVAYCEWKSARDGRTYTLPTSDEWARAARGADGRLFAWGEVFDWNWIAAAGSPINEGRPRPWPRGTGPHDISPFGVRDVAGGVREFCSDPGTQMARTRVVRGGAWGTLNPSTFELPRRALCSDESADMLIGFRLRAPLPKR
jgi:serine/threonine-protein kinase